MQESFLMNYSTLRYVNGNWDLLDIVVTLTSMLCCVRQTIVGRKTKRPIPRMHSTIRPQFDGILRI